MNGLLHKQPPCSDAVLSLVEEHGAHGLSDTHQKDVLGFSLSDRQHKDVLGFTVC